MPLAFRTEWVRSGAVKRLLGTLNEGTQLTDSGGIQFTAGDHSDLFFLLADCVATKSDLTRQDISSISYRSFIELRKRGDVRQSELASEMSRRATELLKEARVPHSMWSKMRLKQMSFHPGSRFEFDGVRIRIVAQLPKKLQLHEQFISGIGRINPNQLPSFGFIIATVDARNENEAAEKIFDALDTFFAVANTAERSLEIWIQRRPTAKFWLGPNQFFFRKEKFLGENKLWSNPRFDQKQWETFPLDAQKFRAAAPQVRRVLAKLRTHPLRKPIEMSLRFVSEGMISGDLAFRLMRFWSAAECLYSRRGEKIAMSKVIDRMVFADDEVRWLTRLKLERAYHLRNEYVHHGSSDSDDTSLVQTLREVILTFAFYLLFNADDIVTHEELLMMLDLPKDAEALSKRARAIERRKLIDSTGRHR